MGLLLSDLVSWFLGWLLDGMLCWCVDECIIGLVNGAKDDPDFCVIC